MRRLALALALLAGAPAPAQEQTAPPPIPAEMLAPNDEARALFEVLASNPLTDEIMATMFAATGAASTRPMDEIIERMFAPGELVPGWQHSGIDPLRRVAALDGGLAGNIAQAQSRFGLRQTYLVDVPFETIAEPEWVVIGRRGAAFSAENVQIEVARVSPKMILVERVAYQRRGNAFCRGQAESRLYSDPAAAASQADMIAVVMTMRTLASLERRGMCQIVEEAGAGRYRTRVFDTEGHRLPALESPETFEIVSRQSARRSQ